MRIIVCGGRDYRGEVAITLAEFIDIAELRKERLTIVHGACPTGADALVDVWASRQFRADVERHPADWDRYGKGAGPRRNAHMVRLGADYVVAFPGGRGTADCVARAKAAGLSVREVRR